jgi:hypothetical protein
MKIMTMTLQTTRRVVGASIALAGRVVPIPPPLARAVYPGPSPVDDAYFAPDVLRDLRQTIGMRPAESGGLLLGPADRDGILRFVFDGHGSTTWASYSPDHETLTRLCERLQDQGLEIKGFCHSHPGLPTPSMGDMRYVQSFFDANPSMRKFYMPIMPDVPIANGWLARDNVGLLDGHDILCWVVLRQRPDEYHRAAIRVEEPEEFPLWASSCPAPAAAVETSQERAEEPRPFDILRLQQLLPDYRLACQSIRLDGRQLLCMTAASGEDECLLLIPREFPLIGPSVIFTGPGKADHHLPVTWELESDVDTEFRLARLVDRAYSESHTRAP